MNVNPVIGGPKTLLAILLTSIFVLFLCCGAPIAFLRVPFFLVVGWIPYLSRVIPALSPNAEYFLTAILCLAVVSLSIHRFGIWLYGSLSSTGSAWSWRWTAGIVGIVLLTFVSGVASIGIIHQTGWLMRSKDSFSKSDFMDTVNTLKNKNNLKYIVFSIHECADNRKDNGLPTSTFTADGRPLHSWQTQLLPYLDQKDLFRKIDFSLPWDHPDNRAAIQTPVYIFQNPDATNILTSSGLPVTHYAANVLTFGGDIPRKFADFEKGLSNTMIIAEAESNPRAWADPVNWRDPRLGLGHPEGFGGSRLGRVLAAIADGSVRSVNAEELAELSK